MQRGERSRSEVRKDKKMILSKERAKKGIEIWQTKVERKKEKVLREVTVKIRLKQEEDKERIVTEALLDSRATGLVMSKEFMRKHKFRRIKLKRPIYMRNVDRTLNCVRPIIDTVEAEIYFKGHKKRMLIDMIGDQKWGVILGMP